MRHFLAASKVINATVSDGDFVDSVDGIEKPVVETKLVPVSPEVMRLYSCIATLSHFASADFPLSQASIISCGKVSDHFMHSVCAHASYAALH